MEQAANVLWIARYDYEPGWVLSEHKHEYYQAIYFLDGVCNFSLDKEEFPIQSEGLILIKPGQKHGLTTDKKVKLKTLDIKFVIKDIDLKNKIDTLHNCLSLPNREVRNIFENIKVEGMEKKSYFTEICNAYLILMLYKLLKIGSHVDDEAIYYHQNIRTDDDVVNNVIKYVQDNYKRNISLETISQALGYNKSYICQRFHKKLKMTPTNYLYKYRIDKSKELIIYSDYSLKQIALMAGFKSIHHFSRIFSQYTGDSPSAYKQREKNNILKDIYIDDKFKNVNYIRQQ